MKSKNYLISGALALVVSLLVVALWTATSAPSVPFGALAGPDIPSPYLNWGNVTEYRSGSAITATSSMLCVLTSPAATSTPRLLSIRFDTQPIGAFALDISTTTSTGYGSSTPAFIASAAVPSVPLKPVVWTFGTASTTSKGVWGAYNLTSISDAGTQTGESSLILPPSTVITFRVATATPRTLSSYPTGKCVASYIVL